MTTIKKWVKDVYQTPVHLTGEDYKKGQDFLILECICGTSMMRLAQGAFIAGFAKMLGMSQGLIGIISAIPMLANVIQLLGGIYFGNMTQYKLPVTFASLIARTLLGTIYFLPLLFIGNSQQAISLVLIYAIANFGIAFLNPPLINWIMDLAPESIRGQYFARREMFTMIIAAIGELIIAKMLDIFKIQGVERLGFNILGIIVIIWAWMSIFAFSKVKEPIRPEKPKGLKTKEKLTMLFGESNFKKLAVLYAIWNFALYIGMLYIAIYMIGDLERSYLYAMVMSMLTLGFRVLSVRLWGKFLQTNLWSKAIELGAILLGIATGLLFFANSTTALFILPLSHILSGIAWGSIGITFFNLQVMFAPDEARTLYIGTLATISGVVGFTATLGSGFFIDYFSSLHINILNFTIGNIQIVFLASGILLALCGIYVKKVIAPMEQKKVGMPSN